MMRKMSWKPGETLGRTNNGLKIPLVGKQFDRLNYQGIGYKEVKEKDNFVAEQIVDILKLKIEQSKADELQEVMSVFEEDSPKQPEEVNFKAEISVQTCGYDIKALIDTGSDITCVSEELWNDVKLQCGNLPVMPIKPVQIRTAVGTRSVEIRSMGLIPIQMGDARMDIGFLIVPGLVREMLIGLDWLTRNEVIISLKTRERGIWFKHDNEKQLVKFLESNLETQDCGEIHTTGRNDKQIGSEILKLNIGITLKEEEKEALEQLLKKYGNLFNDTLGRANCYQHEIKMNRETPVLRKTYPIPYAYRQKVEEKLRTLELQGIISRAATPFCSPLTFTLKKDGEIRVLLDAREINKFMIAETEKPPLQIDVMNAFHGTNYISIVDLNNAYFQIGLTEDSKKYTGFTFNGKSFVYNVLPQGLKTSVGSFSRAMDLILGHEVREFCVNYLDDLAIITTGTLQKHMEHLETVLEKLSVAGLTCNIKKCEFLCKEVKMLGYIISTEGIRTDPDKVRAIRDFPVPKKLKQVRAFLGLCNFYRRFIPEYSLHIQPLCHLLKKETDWDWSDVEQRAFDNIKNLFIKTIQLHHPDIRKPYYLQTDSSGIGMAGVLYQEDERGVQMVLGFHSKTLKGAQINWTVTEQEFYAVICCLEKFETYLRGSKVIIKTDHKALIFVKNWRLYNARVTRWINYLEQFDYEVQHIKGSENVVADVLSRYLPEKDLLQEDKIKMPEILYTETTPNSRLNEKLKELPDIQRKDKEIAEIIDKLHKVEATTGKIGRIIDRCVMKNEVLCLKTGKGKEPVIYLPTELREELIKQIHLEMGHQGAFKMIKYIRDRFFWKGLTRQVRRWVKTCSTCQLTKSNNTNSVGPCRSIVTSDIGEIVMVDLYGPLPTGKFGMNYILVIQDSFSKFIKLYDLRKATAISVLCKMKKFMKIIRPKSVMSDNGSQFASKVWRKFMKEQNIQVIYTTVRNPRPNTTERVNKELGRLFRTYCNANHKSWVSIVPKLELLYNNTYHSSTGFTPCEVMYGESTNFTFDQTLPGTREKSDLTVIREQTRLNLKKASLERQFKFNQRYRIIQYQIGDLVKIRRLNRSDAEKKITKKFERLYEGPYIIVANPYRNVYILVEPESNQMRGKFNAIHLSRYYT